jgi:signal transduction histidine kinase
MEKSGLLATGLALGWVTLVVGFLAYQAVRRWWRLQRYGTPIDHNALLMEYGRKMSSAPDQAALAKLLTVELPGAFQVERTVLLLPERYQLIGTDGNDLHLPISHAAVRWVASSGEAQKADGGRLRELIEQGRADLGWTRAWVPLMRGTDLRGLWLLGGRSHATGHRPPGFAPEDLRCLTAIGRQAATMLEASAYAEQERRTASEMRTLYRQVVAARELERSRLARELHDGVLQDLCAVTRDLKALDARGEISGTIFTDLADRSGATVNGLRAVCNDLRPPLLQHDLGVALKALVEQLDARSLAPVHIDIVTGELHLRDDTALSIFRIAQEALHNAIQHADASEIAVRLTQYPDRLRLTVTDDGRGIVDGVDPARFVAQGHFGLAGMRERAAMIGARLDVQTAADFGTVVILELSR